MTFSQASHDIGYEGVVEVASKLVVESLMNGHEKGFQSIMSAWEAMVREEEEEEETLNQCEIVILLTATSQSPKS